MINQNKKLSCIGVNIVQGAIAHYVVHYSYLKDIIIYRKGPKGHIVKV